MYKELLLNKLLNKNLTLDDFDLRNNFTNYIVRQMRKHQLTIGKGVVGKVYYIDDTYVVKQVTPCKFSKDNPLYKYCQDIKELDDRLIQLIPSGNNQHRYILPNLLSEIVIGAILGEFDIGFSKTHASMILEEHDDLSIYIVMNKLNPMPQITKTNIYYVLFQVAHSIMNAQQKYRFTHFDLHVDNLLYDKWPEDKKNIHYQFEGNDVYIDKYDCPFIVKITDFASSRLETKNMIIAPSNDTYPINTYGEFNPSYDFACLMGSILIYNKFRSKFSSLLSDKKLYKQLLKLLLWFFEDDYVINNNENLNKVRDMIGDKYYKRSKDKKSFSYRPKTDASYVPYLNTKSMIDVINYLSSFIKNTKSDKNIIVKDLSPYRRNTNIVLYNASLKIPTKPKKNNSIFAYDSMVVDDYITVTKYHILYNKVPNKNNLTIESRQIDHCPVQEHYITTMYVNKNHTQQFMFDCCKLDAVNYMINNHKVGFVMNGGFYAYKDDFLPIGPYKDKYNFINEYKIPEEFKDVYGYIVLKNNKLSIKKTYNGKDQVLTTAPILIYNGKVVFHSDEERYNCGDKKKNKDIYVSESDTKIKLKGHYKYDSLGDVCVKSIVIDPVEYQRCDKITPGNLQHANNPNPRAALCLLRNGDYVFVCFEGRENKGDGIDLESMANALLTTYPTIKNAINMDGGVSSNLTWRTKNEQNTVYISNPARYKYYPAGNIIGLFA